MLVTAIIACKDRQENLDWCVSSLKVCYPRPHVIIVDFGSKIPINYSGYKSWLSVIRVDRHTELFHKARAINIGIKNAKTRFICITDADQIFQNNFFGILKDMLQNNLQKNITSFVMCKTHFLLEKPQFKPFEYDGIFYNDLLNKAKQDSKKLVGDGCCHAVLTRWALDVHGYDETYVGYRAQDSDFSLRASRSGLNKIWVPDNTSMIHLPHARMGKYYSEKFRAYNVKKYWVSTKKPSPKIVIANKNGVWGEV